MAPRRGSALAVAGLLLLCLAGLAAGASDAQHRAANHVRLQSINVRRRSAARPARRRGREGAQPACHGAAPG